MKKLLLLSLLIAGMVSLQATDKTPQANHSSSTVVADQISSTGTVHNATITPTPSYDLAIFFGTLIGAGILGTSLAAAIMYFRSKKHHTPAQVQYQYPLLALEEIIVAPR